MNGEIYEMIDQLSAELADLEERFPGITRKRPETIVEFWAQWSRDFENAMNEFFAAADPVWRGAIEAFTAAFGGNDN